MSIAEWVRVVYTLLIFFTLSENKALIIIIAILVHNLIAAWAALWKEVSTAVVSLMIMD